VSIQLDSSRLRSALERGRGSVRAPGVVAGLAINGQAPIIVAAGTADVESGRALLTTDRLRVGSITKTFTATAVLQLADTGALHLSDTVSRWVPTVPCADSITVEHLLRHTSGLFNYTDSQAFLALAHSTDKPRIWAPEELVEYANDDNHLFSPGDGWAYSNTNYILLGMIIRRTTQQSLATVFRQGIFTPLEMMDTFLDGEEPAASRRLVPGYSVHPEDPAQFVDMSNAMHVSAAWAAGGIVSTAEDLLTFNRALFGKQVLKPASLSQMRGFTAAADPFYPMVNGYGLGLVSMEIAGKACHGHVGNIPGYSSLLAYLPYDEAYLIVLMNQNYTRLGGIKINVEVIAEAILETMFL
jgi:D-alanyl-D-alanine carboxypeptidase